MLLIFGERRGGIQISTQDQVRKQPLIVPVQFYFVEGQWDADCADVGLVGYGDKDFNKAREKVFEALRFFYQRDDIEFTEQIIEVKE